MDHIQAPNLICKHPFDWGSIVKEVLVDSRMNTSQFSAYKQNLEQAGLTCTIKHSTVSL